MLVTLVVYYPAWHGGGLWDDDAHLTRPELQSLAGLWRIWFDLGATQQYYPIAHSAFWTMHALWGDVTLGYHVVNILLHAASAGLVAVIMRRLKLPGEWIGALLFAVHPVHVESVAWMTELKNTLSGVLYLTAGLAYLFFDDRRQRRHYVLAFGLFALALLTKSVTATLPAALLVVFWWQRGRLSWRTDTQPLLPFFGLGLFSGLFTAWIERTQIGAEGALFQFSVLDRVVIAGRALWFYLAKLFWPGELLFVYPRWPQPAAVSQLLYPAAALAVIAMLWAIRGRTRGPLAAALFFAGTLFPALGFLNVYPFIYSFVADHFQYLASLGVIVPCAALIGAQAARMKEGATVLATAAIVLCGPLAVRAYVQSGQYVDAETLYRTTLAQNPTAWLAHINLGWLYLKAGRTDLAIAESRAALAIKPDLSQAQNNLGSALLSVGQADGAVVAFREALRLKPTDVEVRRNLGLALVASADRLVDAGQVAGAVAIYQDALTFDASSPEAHHNFGSALARLGRTDDAIVQYLETLRLNPSSVRATRNLARAYNARGIDLASAGRLAEAIGDFSNAVRLDPDLLDAQANLARAKGIR